MENQDVEVHEEEEKEDQLWNEFTENIYGSTEVNMVPQAEQDSKQHVNDTNDD